MRIFIRLIKILMFGRNRVPLIIQLISCIAIVTFGGLYFCYSSSYNQTWNNHDDCALARYLHLGGNIVIFGYDCYGNKVSPEQMQYTSTHEICHSIWFDEFNNSARKEYSSISFSENTTVSEYAKTNLEEDFAESCAYYVMNWSIDSRRFKFFNKTILLQKVQ